MTETRFTPAPWHFLEAHSHDDDYSRDHELTICDDIRNDDLASIFSSADSTVSTSREEAVANAHLIAAAPDLYAALEFYANPEIYKPDWRGTAPDVTHVARAALKKARGETP